MALFAEQKISTEIARSFHDTAAAEASAPAAERRRSFRRPLGIIATISRIINDECVHPLQVLVMNASEQGYGLRTPAALARGELYQLRIGSADAVRASAVRIISCRRRQHGDLFDVGVEVV